MEASRHLVKSFGQKKGTEVNIVRNILEERMEASRHLVKSFGQKKGQR